MNGGLLETSACVGLTRTISGRIAARQTVIQPYPFFEVAIGPSPHEDINRRPKPAIMKN